MSSSLAQSSSVHETGAMPCRAVPDEAALDRLTLRLFSMGAPKIFVWLVVLTYFQEDMWPAAPLAFEMIEMFAGDAAISKSCRLAWISTAALDVRYSAGMRRSRKRHRKQDPFDLTSAAGFALLGSILFLFLPFHKKIVHSRACQGWLFGACSMLPRTL